MTVRPLIECADHVSAPGWNRSMRDGGKDARCCLHSSLWLVRRTIGVENCVDASVLPLVRC